MKLVSKANKTIKTEPKLDASQLCSKICLALNERLKLINKNRTFDFDEQSHDIVEVGNTFGLQTAEDEASGLVSLEVLKFENNNGFMNIFLVNEQFMDRVQSMVKKKSISNKDSFS